MKVSGSITADQLEYLEKIKMDKKNSEKIKNQKLNKDSFMKLMLAQLQNQNPMDPMDNKEMLAQLTQMSSVETMGTLTKSFEDTTKMVAMISAQMEGLGALVKGSGEHSEEMLKQLEALNTKLDAYFSSEDKPDSDEMLDNITDGTGATDDE